MYIIIGETSSKMIKLLQLINSISKTTTKNITISYWKWILERHSVYLLRRYHVWQTLINVGHVKVMRKEMKDLITHTLVPLFFIYDGLVCLRETLKLC